MKLFTEFLFAGCLLLLSACGNHQQPAAAASNTPKTDSVTDKFFPIADYLRSEISNVDTAPLVIMKFQTVRQKTDTTYLTPNEFNQLAANFLTPELNADSLEKNFLENSFSDKTTGYLTFTYSPKDKEQPLQRIDVLLSPSRGGTNKVKSIYLERVAKESDTLMIKKMFWQAGHNFQVITSLQPAGKKSETRQVKVVWNNEEAD